MKRFLNPALLLSAAALLSSAVHAQTIVCVETNLDSFCMELLQTDAPQATANFLRYVDDGDYTNTLIHGSVRSGYLLGGLFQASLDQVDVPADAAINNEFKLPNERGTIALTTTAGQPNSATSGWRVNVADNRSTFSSSANSGAVFARVIGDGMLVVDRLAKLSVHALNGGHLSQAPLLQLDNAVTADDLVQVKRIYRYGGTIEDFNNYGVSFPPKDPALVDMRDVVCMQTTLGELCSLLFPETAPKTVANFMNYVNDHDYDGSFFHRSVSGFVLQGGGFRFGSTISEIPADPAVVNEYSLPNTRNTIAMAKLGNDPNSATNQWFFNLADNSTNLGTANNGGFTVFGEVILSDRGVLNALAGVRAYDISATFGSAFAEVPLVNPDVERSADDFVNIESVYVAQRDIAATEDSVVSPLAKVVALGTYGSQVISFGARFPVRVGPKLYNVILNKVDGDPNLFTVDLIRIIELKDNGRIAATYDGRFLKIPTLRAGDKIYANVLLELTNPRTLEFYLHSYEQL